MNDLTPIGKVARAPMHEGPRLSRRQKAAIIVRFLQSEGAEVSLADLPEDLQAALTQQMGAMRHIDRATLARVVCEFAEELEQIGLSFPRGLLGALSAMDGQISAQTAARLRREAGVRQMGDPWARIRTVDVAELLAIIDSESTEVSAVLLSKLDVAKAAEVLGQLPGDRARLLTYAVSQTEGVTPEAVDRIGLSLATQLDDVPVKAFDDGPDKRVGAILNLSPSATRDALLDGLAQDDAAFAEQVRKAIFTFPDIATRLVPNDVPAVVRGVDQAVLVTALKFAADSGQEAASEFILSNMSKRLSEGLREEMAALGVVKEKPGEEAQNAVIAAIRAAETAGDITLITPEPEDD